jgi:hypothetical protein
MKFRPARAAVFSIGTSLLLLSGIRCAQAGEIKIVSPSAYKDRAGEGRSDGGSFPPFRGQQVFPAADFAALGNQPHWLVNDTLRPDESQTSSSTVHFPDNEFRYATTQTGPNNLSTFFAVNLGSDFKHFYRGPWTLVTDIDDTSPVPREFSKSNYAAGVTPYLYDPSQGNLLLDFIGWGGLPLAGRGDLVPSMQTALNGSSPVATEGVRGAAFIHQFTFIPVTPGDYNRDATVDAADYVVWRKGLGTTYTQADYDVWRANFGQTIGSSGVDPLSRVPASADPLPIAIPEPATLALLIMAIVVHCARRRSAVS